MDLAVVNGASAIARGVTKLLARGSSGVKILDSRVYRPAVYKLQEELGSVNVEKHQILSSKSLEYALEDSETVVYFTHDYLSMNFAKNAVLEATARAAKTVGVKKLICVRPIEYESYYNEDGKDPIGPKNELEDKALGINSDLVFLHPNLVFGDYSYLIRYITQSVVVGKIPKSLANTDDAVKYFPVHIEDLAKAIQHSIDNFDKVKGQTYAVNGDEGVTLAQIKDLIEKHSDKKTSFYTDLGIMNFLREFTGGFAHDSNMIRMAEYFKKNSWEFTHENDYFKEHGLSHDHKLSTFFRKEHLAEENLVFPTFSGYKNSELD